jgi:hypothetical protein
MKIAFVFLILLLILLAVMGVTVTGDGTLKGRLQTFVSYGLSLTSFLLCLLTIVVSIYSLSSDIKQRQIYTVITKPIRRFELLVGKLVGVILLSSALLVLFSAIIYAITIYLPKFSGASEAELKRARNEFFTARASLTPAEFDVSEEVADTYKKLSKSGQFDQVFRGRSRKEILARLTTWKKLQKRAAAVGDELIWEFEGLPTRKLSRLGAPDNVKPLGPEQSLFIRYKYDVSVNPPDLQVYGKWIVGDIRQIRYGTGIQTPIYDVDRKDLVRTFHELEVPADAVAADGYLAVGFRNVPLNNTVVIFPLEDGLEVLVKADTFTANFIRAALLVLLRLIFLACLGILAASFLSFPVAVLLCLVIFFTASASGFVIDSFDYLSENLSSVYYYTFRPVIQLLPRFDRFSPTGYLISARLLSWSLLGEVAGLMVCLKAVCLLLLGVLIFSYREVARTAA